MCAVCPLFHNSRTNKYLNSQTYGLNISARFSFFFFFFRFVVLLFLLFALSFLFIRNSLIFLNWNKDLASLLGIKHQYSIWYQIQPEIPMSRCQNFMVWQQECISNKQWAIKILWSKFFAGKWQQKKRMNKKRNIYSEIGIYISPLHLAHTPKPICMWITDFQIVVNVYNNVVFVMNGKYIHEHDFNAAHFRSVACVRCLWLNHTSVSLFFRLVALLLSLVKLQLYCSALMCKVCVGTCNNIQDPIQL